MKLLGILVIITSLTSCEKFIKPENRPLRSTFDLDESHYNGRNCMNCHYSEGRGEGWFTMAGSMDRTLKWTVNLHTDTLTPPFYQLEMDARGNFYTTDELNFDGGVYASITNELGETKYMEDKIYHGVCTLCHGSGGVSPLLGE